MRQGLQLKISQQLTMTPQLQQAIRLLQLSTLELRQEMIEQLYNNPLLEMDDDNSQGVASAETLDSIETDPTTSQGNSPDSPELGSQGLGDNSTPESGGEQNTDHNPDQNREQGQEYDWNGQIPQDLPVDANWDDVYSPTTANSTGGEVNLEQVYQVTESFQGHLEWQLNLTPFSDRDREIAEAFIDAINSSGFIDEGLLDIVAHIQPEDSQPEALEEQIQEDELVAVLHRLQQFDPPGVFARNIRECLLIQLQQMAETEHLQSAVLLVSDFLEDIASIDSARLNQEVRS